MKTHHRQLAFLGLLTTCAAVNESPQYTRDLISQLNGGSDLDTISSSIHEPGFGDMPSSSSPPPLNRGDTLLGINLLSHPSGELRNGPTVVPYAIHIRTPSNKRMREDELPMTFSIHSESRKPTETLDLLKEFGKYPMQDSSANLVESPMQAVSPHRATQTDGNSISGAYNAADDTRRLSQP
ncbi:hypothetical protein PGTUg99_016045 [Puccinia graminis f. sp. tritici]|uniref:Uncharacterized protein n=1 Tax=Puccinia graminis f. sp. tritici TaxID=56615 RepID=A0A5B0PW60_PUCGR|nr:hypothetical protein PGTUg99_016045 [Puccinia graminis f. sp. tritici]